MAGPPWLDADREELDPVPLPARSDVLVVGAGLAGAAIALWLAERGVAVTVLEERARGGAGASGRQPGHVTSGVLDHPYRIAASMGDARAAELFAFSRSNHALLAQLGVFRAVGGDWAATDPREAEAIALSVEALDRLGVRAELRPDPNAALGTRGLGPSMHLPGDGILDVDAVDVLLRRARAAGARVVTGARATSFRVDARGAVVQVGAQVVVAEVVVLAAEVGLPDLDPWFGDKITPVREQALITAPLGRALPAPAGRAGYGYTFWRQLDDGRLIVGGCRWATPHLEAGERDETVVVGRIQDRIEAFARQHLDLPPVTGRWSWIVGHTCDGLPLVGPMPGNPTVIACAGFCGNTPGLAAAAARAVVDGLLGPGAPEVPDFLHPSRFL